MSEGPPFQGGPSRTVSSETVDALVDLFARLILGRDREAPVVTVHVAGASASAVSEGSQSNSAGATAGATATGGSSASESATTAAAHPSVEVPLQAATAAEAADTTGEIRWYVVWANPVETAQAPTVGIWVGRHPRCWATLTSRLRGGTYPTSGARLRRARSEADARALWFTGGPVPHPTSEPAFHRV